MGRGRWAARRRRRRRVAGGARARPGAGRAARHRGRAPRRLAPQRHREHRPPHRRSGARGASPRTGTKPTRSAGGRRTSGCSRCATTVTAPPLPTAPRSASSPRRTWTYRGTIRFARRDDGWRAVWSPTNVHPQLTGGSHGSTETVSWPARARDPGRGRHAAHRRRRRRDRRHRAAADAEPRRDVRRAAARPSASTPPTAARAVDAPGVQPDYFVPITTVPEAEYQAVQAPDLRPCRGCCSAARRNARRRRRSSRRTWSARPARSPRSSSTSSVRPTPRPIRVGRSGLERAVRAATRRDAVAAIQLVDGRRDGRPHGALVPGRAPRPVRTTLDLATQQRAEAALGTTAPAALVAVRPSDGAVRAVVSTPVTEEFDRALDGAYPPGSTFKVVTATALLRNGVTLDTAGDVPADAHGQRHGSSATSRARPSRRCRSSARSRSRATPRSSASPRSCPTDALATAARVVRLRHALDLGLAARPGSFPDPR